MKKNISNLSNYDKIRAFPLGKTNTTSHLSDYNKFGCFSIRELYHYIINTIDNNEGLVRQIVWRDFYYNIVFNYPEIFKGNPESK